MTPRKTVILNMLDSYNARTAGGGTGWTYIEISCPAAAGFGPTLESVRFHYRSRGRSANLEWKVVTYWSVDESDWSPAIDLHTAVSAEGMGITTAYTTVGSFGLRMRYALAVRASVGTAVEGAITSLFGEFTFKS